jgi:hypothetical protein
MAAEIQAPTSIRPAGRSQPVVQVRRRTETEDAPGWQGARRENIAHM